ncbi:hypothetical protein Scep_026053 [Stephania cephalantha]|uniref:Uncharacterized protein n=1 Tax=Stephania cephalantha TaxID=152367 RepID=A0AAP0ETA7_9MAGN
MAQTQIATASQIMLHSRNFSNSSLQVVKSSSTLDKKNIADFWKFIACFKAFSYISKIYFMCCASYLSAQNNRKLSSAKNKCVTYGAPRDTLHPCMSPSLSD